LRVADHLFDGDVEDIDGEAREDQGDGVRDFPAAGEERHRGDGEEEQEDQLDENGRGHSSRVPS
jgi:hypothetical protein